MLFPAFSVRLVIRTFAAAMMAAVVSSECSAAEIVPGELIQVSGRSIFGVEMSVIEYFAPIAPAAGARNVGDREVKRFDLTFRGYVDDTRMFFDYTDGGYIFSNDWVAFTNSGPGTSSTACGLVIDFCTGVLAGPDYRVAAAYYELNYTLVLEGGNPINGDPVNWFFVETVIFENISNPEDFHYFTAGGRSIPVTEVPLPSTLGFMFGAVACTAGILRRRRRFA